MIPSWLDPALLFKLIPGALGSLFSMLWIKDSPIRMFFTFGGGITFSYYATPFTVKVSGLDSGIAGFLLGLFTMAIVSSLFAAWAKIDLPSILKDALRGVLRVPEQK